MPRNRLAFRQRDITAAIKAVERAGNKVYRVLIGKDGSIVVELAPPGGNETAPARAEQNPWDRVYRDDYKL